MRVLVIEDEVSIAEVIRDILKCDGFGVNIAHTGEEGETILAHHTYDLIILDLVLPGKDGFAVCRSLRGKLIETPILMITAKLLDEIDEIKGLSIGASDYLRKPFSSEMLRAHVSALMRGREQPGSSQITVGKIVLDTGNQQVIAEHSYIDLTRKETELLHCLMKQSGRVLSRETIEKYVWNTMLDSSSNLVDVNIARLRGKLARAGIKNVIQTLPGRGYRFQKQI